MEKQPPNNVSKNLDITQKEFNEATDPQHLVDFCEKYIQEEFNRRINEEPQLRYLKKYFTNY